MHCNTPVSNIAVEREKASEKERETIYFFLAVLDA